VGKEEQEVAKKEPADPEEDVQDIEDMDEEGPTPEEMLEQERQRYLRLAAEFDNYRKRTERDMAEFRRRAANEVLLSMLDVLDNLDRALEASEGCEPDDLVTGLHAIRNQMMGILERASIVPIEAEGREFDPFEMEAVMRMPSDKVPEGGVVTELQKGYKAPDHVLRHSKVIVSSGPERPECE